MKIRMLLLSDAILGNGVSVPGAEDISVLTDVQGFPYYKGSTFKGIFREELQRLFTWTADPCDTNDTDNHLKSEKISKLLGSSGDDNFDSGKIVFSDFVLSENVKNAVLNEINYRVKQKTVVQKEQAVLQAFTHLRTFTALDDEGIVKKGSLRNARCINKGITFESEILCNKEHEKLVEEVIGQIRWIGTMRNRGFGKVLISRKGDE